VPVTRVQVGGARRVSGVISDSAEARFDSVRLGQNSLRASSLGARIVAGRAFFEGQKGSGSEPVERGFLSTFVFGMGGTPLGKFFVVWNHRWAVLLTRQHLGRGTGHRSS